MLLKNKIIVITGSTRGIGKGIALKIAENGGIPVITGTNKELLFDILPKEFEKLGYSDLLFLECDVRKEEDVKHVMEAAHKKYGRIDGVCANAGMTDMCPFEEMTPERFDKMI